MAGRSRIVRFDDWTAGEYGDLGASSAPDKSFTGSNVIRYTNGLLGPRPGLKNLAPTSVPTGVVWGMRGTGTGTRGIVFGVGTSVYGFTFGVGNAASSIGTVATTPTLAQIIQFGSDAYCVISGDKAYKIDPAAAAVTAYASAPGGECICIYGERMIIGYTAAAANRIRYSAANDYTTWSANYVDVGSVDWGITYVEEIRNRLAIANEGGEWWNLSGVPGVNDVLRRTPREDAAPRKWHNAARLNERLLFNPYSDDYPVGFTGAVSDKFRYAHLRFTGSSGNNIGVAGQGGQDMAMFVEATSSSPKGLLFYQQTPTYHTFGIAASRLISPVSTGAIASENNPFILCDGGGAASAGKFYAFAPFLDRPGKTGDTLAQPGDDSTTPVAASFTTPEWWSPNGEEVTVRAVRVDFAKWNTGSSSTNHFDLQVRSLHRYNQASTKDSAVIAFDEAASTTTSDGTTDSRVYRFGDQGTGHGFQIVCSAMRGVAIDRFIVEIDLDPARH